MMNANLEANKVSSPFFSKGQRGRLYKFINLGKNVLESVERTSQGKNDKSKSEYVINLEIMKYLLLSLSI